MSIDCQGNDLKMINYFIHRGPFAEAVCRSAKLDVSRPYVIGMLVPVPQEMKLEPSEFRPYPDALLP